MGDHDHDHDSIFLTQEGHEMFLLSQMEVNEEAEESEQQAFENAIMEVHRQYNLRSKKTNENSLKKAAETKKTSKNLPKKVPERNKAGPHTQKSSRNTTESKLDLSFIN